jgi:hypothetical protein
VHPGISWPASRLPSPISPEYRSVGSCTSHSFPPPEHASSVCKCSRGCAFSAAVRFAQGVGFPCPCQFGRVPTSESVVRRRGRDGTADGQGETLQGRDRNCRWIWANGPAQQVRDLVAFLVAAGLCQASCHLANNCHPEQACADDLRHARTRDGHGRRCKGSIRTPRVGMAVWQYGGMWHATCEDWRW